MCHIDYSLGTDIKAMIFLSIVHMCLNEILDYECSVFIILKKQNITLEEDINMSGFSHMSCCCGKMKTDLAFLILLVKQVKYIASLFSTMQHSVMQNKKCLVDRHVLNHHIKFLNNSIYLSPSKYNSKAFGNKETRL